MVKRYDCTSGGAQWCQGCYTMEEESDRVDGNWVRAEDYDTLAALLASYPRDKDGWICSVCQGWNVPKDRVCMHSHLPTSLQRSGNEHG